MSAAAVVVACALIALRGACAQSTQSRLLTEELTRRGVCCRRLAFPDRTLPSGVVISNYLQRRVDLDDTAVHNLFALNRWELQQQMREWLLAGETLICDRYAFSGAAYTSAKGFDLRRCQLADRGVLAPDLVFYLDVSVEEVASRAGYGAERYEHRDFQRAVQQRFELLFDARSWTRVNGRNAVADVHADVLVAADAALQALETRPLRRLWLALDERAPHTVAHRQA